MYIFCTMIILTTFDVLNSLRNSEMGQIVAFLERPLSKKLWASGALLHDPLTRGSATGSSQPFVCPQSAIPHFDVMAMMPNSGQIGELHYLKPGWNLHLSEILILFWFHVRTCTKSASFNFTLYRICTNPLRSIATEARNLPQSEFVRF